MCFSNIDHLNSWIMSEGNTIQIIGFLGAGFLPVGSWIRNAVRNFEDTEVEAVCGPLLPGPFANRLEQAACNLASSSISTGSDSYLYSLKPVNAVTKGFMDNVFVRATVLSENKLDRKLSIENDIIYTKASDSVLRYDPDVAVSRPAPSLFLPYGKAVARDAFLKGHGFSSLKITRERLWAMAPVLVWLMVLAGWIVIPLPVYYILCAVYLAIIIMAGLMCFDLRSTFLFVIGMLLEHLVRSFAFSAGIIIWILGIKRK